jgi:TM2 domain-containing membrane protein YozV
VSPRRARLAWHLSFWVPGLGQLYRRQWAKGAVLLAMSSALSDRALALYPWSALSACARPAAPIRLLSVVVALTAVWVFAVLDAGRDLRHPMARAATAPERPPPRSPTRDWA